MLQTQEVVLCLLSHSYSNMLTWFNVFKGVLVKASPPLWNQFKFLAVREIAKWFWVGAKPSFAFMHFQSQPLNLSHKLLFSLSACLSPLLYFPFPIPVLPWKSLNHLPEKMSLQKEDMKGWWRPWGLIHTYTMTEGSEVGPYEIPLNFFQIPLDFFLSSVSSVFKIEFFKILCFTI